MYKLAASIVMVSALMAWGASVAASPPSTNTPPVDSLFDKISALDAAVFDAFNHCSEPGQLERHASYFAPDVEFYHDQGGVTWTRDAMIANTKKNVCNHFRRELIPGTLKVYPIKDFGAIEQGVHRFCQFKTGDCEGMADFVIVWRHQGDQWQITRVLSYGHRPNKQPG
ncbi:nuclear transport factor 2 family protein [Rhodanobacter sp. C03]|uniref:nuclear transport factor 2 family protein n=1 Tax=Rhodanobacter sp. C03 TaxID=1945858 RepID=UPI0009859C36|nr:nuclear transport factor 2 family protein [Rhodanobacter sp. C03]OOG55450.1 DUF4440 domain-containing protein [Rhodanobacter sp. C03]